MPKRSSTTGKQDFNQRAFAIVQAATDPGPAAPEIDMATISQVMSEMGRKGGKRGGAARARSLTPERRAEIAREAARKRWKDKSDSS